MIKNGLLVFGIAMLLFSCRKKEDPITGTTPPQGNSQVQITFQNMAGDVPLALNTAWYKNEMGDSVSISVFKYYISNINLFAADGSMYSEPESYHLIDEATDLSKVFTIADVPQGSYTKMSFTIGVDARHNTSGAQTGALDPIYGMFWDWNTGYIMAKMEGNSPKSSFPDGKFYFHIGGFKGQYSVLRQVELNLPAAAEISKTKNPNIHINADALEWFKTPNLIDLSITNAELSPGPVVAEIASNYADMFKIDHID